METFRIHINGIVQGVGFRPLIYQLAKEIDLAGYVKNGSDGIDIHFNASLKTASLFFKKIKQSAPRRSKIISSDLQRIPDRNFSGFNIVVEDDDNGEKQVLTSPDTAICGACRSELHDIKNRRFRYPFITCTQCGPRYSIIKNLPYERHNTSMENYSMCKKCKEEYKDVFDRRFFSQTNSCADCGIEICIWDSRSSRLSNDSEKVLSHIKNFLQQGKIIAVKGVGGYLLLCAADNTEVVQLLRSRKCRPAKPFALLYRDIEMIGQDMDLNIQEKALLESPGAPIVLLYPKREAFKHIAINHIAPGLNRLGVMLPGNPLLELIAGDFEKPLIATSANISGSPIIYKDEDALEYLFKIADFIVGHNREIIIPQDDGVAAVSKYARQTIIFRRSRGYAPSFLHYTPQTKASILATGAFLKSSFTFAAYGNVFTSQFLGSGESYESQQMYKHTLDHLLKLYEVIPEVIITDTHPNYFSNQYAAELAEKYGAELKFIQHHEAHFAAALAEHHLLHPASPVLGVIWDGTGLGSDGNVWGGEFFKYENDEMIRCYHFDYFPSIARDKPALEPRIAALCAASDVWPPSNQLKEKFTEAEWNNYQSLIHTTKLFTSSVGRIFDAVASLLDVCDKQSYEGEAAMYLQVLAEDYVNIHGFEMDDSYFKEGAHYYRIPTASLIQGIMLDIKNNKPGNYIAAKFHYSLVCLIGIVTKNLNIKQICFSGGVFQNALLVDWIHHEYNGIYQLYFHQNLSPNDENISFGQMAHYDFSCQHSTTSYQLLSNNSVHSSLTCPR